MKELLRQVTEQAEDEGLWFDAATAPEAYLQEALRHLHTAVETAQKNALSLPDGYSISEAESTPKAWLFIQYQAARRIEMEAEQLKTYKKLCKYEGHVPISGVGEEVYCELCCERIG